MRGPDSNFDFKSLVKDLNTTIEIEIPRHLTNRIIADLERWRLIIMEDDEIADSDDEF